MSSKIPATSANTPKTTAGIAIEKRVVTPIRIRYTAKQIFPMLPPNFIPISHVRPLIVTHQRPISKFPICRDSSLNFRLLYQSMSKIQAQIRSKPGSFDLGHCWITTRGQVKFYNSWRTQILSNKKALAQYSLFKLSWQFPSQF